MNHDRTEALAEIARDLRDAEARARKLGAEMLAYMIDMAAIEAEAEVKDQWRRKPQA